MCVSQVIRSVHNLMTKLMSIYPTDFPGSSSTIAKCDELEPLYGHVSKVCDFCAIRNSAHASQAISLQTNLLLFAGGV
jgi:hypothetical protein